jgi:hypothetical protein
MSQVSGGLVKMVRTVEVTDAEVTTFTEETTQVTRRMVVVNVKIRFLWTRTGRATDCTHATLGS